MQGVLELFAVFRFGKNRERAFMANDHFLRAVVKLDGGDIAFVFAIQSFDELRVVRHRHVDERYGLKILALPQ